MPVRFSFGRIVIAARRTSRGRWIVEAYEADDAENLTPLIGFAPREVPLEALVERLESLASEAETVRLKCRTGSMPRSKPERAFGVFRGTVQVDGRFVEPIAEDMLAREESEFSIGRIERLARVVAVKGRAEAERLLSIATRAVELLDDPRLQRSLEFAKQEAEPLPFAWEVDDEQASHGTPDSIFLASSDDYATGEGLTLYFAVGYAQSDNEFRRKLAREWGAGLADRARVARGADAEVPYAALFLSRAFRAAIKKMEQREGGPGAFSFFARQHANYS